MCTVFWCYCSSRLLCTMWVDVNSTCCYTVLIWCISYSVEAKPGVSDLFIIQSFFTVNSRLARHLREEHSDSILSSLQNTVLRYKTVSFGPSDLIRIVSTLSGHITFLYQSWNARASVVLEEERDKAIYMHLLGHFCKSQWTAYTVY